MKSRSRWIQVAAIALALLLVSGVAAGSDGQFTAPAGATYETDSGLLVDTTVEHDVPGEPFPATDTVNLSHIRVSASGSATATLDQLTRTRTNVSGIDASSNAVTINPDDKSQVTVSGSVTALSFSDVALDGTTQFRYTADDPGTITVTGLPANTDFGAVTPGGAVVDTGTTDGSGTASIEVSSGSNQDVVLVQPDAPVPDNNAATPQDTELNDREVTLSVPVNDSDFPVGDEVEAQFYLNGEQVATQNISQNATVSTTVTLEQGGTNEWHVDFTDAYGQTAQTDQFSFQAVAELRVLNESAPTELVNGTSVEVTFFGSNTTVIRESNDGRINFTGLPLDEEFVADVDADGYRSRSVVIPSLLDQQRVYLLPENVSAAQVRFTLDDVTGTYSERSTLYVEKPITINNTTQYQIIVSDQFGVEGVTTYLEEGVRYELRVVNEQGVTAELSTYRADTSETRPLQPSAASVERPEDDSVGYEIVYSEENEEITVEYVDPTASTEELTVSVISRDNQTVLKAPKTYTDTNSLSLSIPTNGTLNQTYYVNVEGDRGDGEIDIREPVGPQRADIETPMPDDVWVQVIGAFAILLVGGVFSQLNRGVGAVITSLFGGVLWFFGFMSGLASGSAVALAIGIATLNLFRSTGVR